MGNFKRKAELSTGLLFDHFIHERDFKLIDLLTLNDPGDEFVYEFSFCLKWYSYR